MGYDKRVRPSYGGQFNYSYGCKICICLLEKYILKMINERISPQDPQTRSQSKFGSMDSWTGAQQTQRLGDFDLEFGHTFKGS